MHYNKERNRIEDERLSKEIRNGWVYAHLAILESFEVNKRLRVEIRKSKDRLVQESAYIREVLERHPDAVSFLANSQCPTHHLHRNRELVPRTVYSMRISRRPVSLESSETWRPLR